MSDRETYVQDALRAQGLKPVLVGIERDQDVWAKFRVNGELVTFVASGGTMTDEACVEDLIRQAREVGLRP